MDIANTVRVSQHACRSLFLLMHLVLCHVNFLSTWNNRILVELNHKPYLPSISTTSLPSLCAYFNSCAFILMLAISYLIHISHYLINITETVMGKIVVTVEEN